MLPVKAADTIPEVLRLATPQISTFNRGTGSRENGELVFETAILNILDFYGVHWRSELITETAQLLYSEYFGMSLAELRHFTLLAKRGDFNTKQTKTLRDEEGKYAGSIEHDGKMYGEIKPPVLMKWMEAYWGECIYNRGIMYGDNHSSPAHQLQEDAPITDEDRVRARQAISEFQRQADAYRKEQMRIRDKDWQKDRQKRLDWLADNERRAREYALAQGVDYDKVRCGLFAERIAKGEQLRSPEDLQFYENHKEIIEEELKRRASQNGSHV